MAKESVFARVEKATVWFPERGGQGVLVNDSLIMTAAHCISHDSEGQMVLGDYYFEKVRINDAEFTVAPLAVEPVAAIAILGAVDSVEFPTQADAFLSICRDRSPLTVRQDDLGWGDEFQVHVYTHKSAWITGTATYFGGPSLSLVTEEQIEGGTSGGPIINDLGQLVGIVSNASDPQEGIASDGNFPYPSLALPVWICQRLFPEV